MTYSDDEYECVPNKNNWMWIPVVILQFLIVAAGLYSHFVFIKLVVLPQKFGSYVRYSFGLISTMMINMLLTSAGAFLIALAHGKLIEDCEISAIGFRKLLLYVHSFGEYFFVICELLGTIERVTTVFLPRFRSTKHFSSCYVFGCCAGVVLSFLYIYMVRISYISVYFAIGFGSITAMEIINGIAVFALWYAAKRKYKSEKTASLADRFELSQSYDYCRCAAASVTARVLIITYVYLKLAGFFEGDLDSGFFYIMNLWINLYCLVYPGIIMMSHRKIKSQLGSMIGEMILFRRPRVKQDGPRKLFTIDGRQMNQMSGDDHFNQLTAFWNSSSHPSTR